jgi:hypothetical protein
MILKLRAILNGARDPTLAVYPVEPALPFRCSQPLWFRLRRVGRRSRRFFRRTGSRAVTESGSRFDSRHSFVHRRIQLVYNDVYENQCRTQR